MKEKKMSIITRVLSGVIGVAGIAASIYTIIGKINAGMAIGSYLKYLAIAFACTIFIYAALTGKNLLAARPKE